MKDKMRRSKSYRTGASEDTTQRQEIFEEIMTNNFSKLIKDMTHWISESLMDSRNPSRITKNQFTCTLIIMKLQNTQKKSFKNLLKKTDYLLKKNKQTNNHNNGGQKAME